MIHYHGGPISPVEAAMTVWKGRHALISWRHPEQIGLAADICQSFVLDNGAFSAWKAGEPVTDWNAYYRWTEHWLKHPGCDWAVIPDVIDGTEEDNDRLITEWPHGHYLGVPVWHLHEPLDRLLRLGEDWPRVALGSSGKYSTPGSGIWWARMREAMEVICDEVGRPITKLHGLRMLNPKLFTVLPVSSGDSATVALNIGLDASHKDEVFRQASKPMRGLALATRIETYNSASVWRKVAA